MRYTFDIEKRCYVEASEASVEDPEKEGLPSEWTGFATPATAEKNPPVVGLGGAPIRNTNLPVDPKERKQYPIASGVLDYFPDALGEVAHVSWQGNEQHNPGQSLRWDRSKSKDEADAMIRHFMQRGLRDSDGLRHSAKMAWRALAELQKEIEEERG